MIQVGQRVRIYGGRVAHIIADTTTGPCSRDTLCGRLVSTGNRPANDLSPDPTLPLCATCARRKDTT